jgi:hypothetical protein
MRRIDAIDRALTLLRCFRDDFAIACVLRLNLAQRGGCRCHGLFSGARLSEVGQTEELAGGACREFPPGLGAHEVSQLYKRMRDEAFETIIGEVSPVETLASQG